MVKTRPPLKPLSRLPTLARLKHFFRLLSTRFIEDQGLLQASSLTYTTLLSLVPLMTVSLAVLYAFPVSDRIADEIQAFIFSNFVPASGEMLQNYFQDFSSKASKLSGVGFAFLIVVALMLMSNIDRAFNIIWRTSTKRSALGKFLVYWAILTLGPILIGSSVAATSYLVSMPIISDTVSSLGHTNFLLRLIPVGASAIGFTLLYSIIPNRQVPLAHALAGGLLAAILFEAAKRGFAAYLTHFPTYEAIYGALAVIPIFLVWIYLSWMVTLLGAEFTCVLGLFHDEGTIAGSDARSDLILAFRLLEELWKEQHQGNTLSSHALSHRLGGVSVERIESMLSELVRARIVLHSDNRRWALSRNLWEFSLYDLYRIRPFLLPPPQILHDARDEAGTALGETLTQVNTDLESALGRPLAEIFDETGQRESAAAPAATNHSSESS